MDNSLLMMALAKMQDPTIQKLINEKQEELKKQERKGYALYQITNKITHRTMVARTFQALEKYLGKNYHCITKQNPLFKADYDKYGQESFEISLIADNLTGSYSSKAKADLIVRYDLRNPERGYHLKNDRSNVKPKIKKSEEDLEAIRAEHAKEKREMLIKAYESMGISREKYEERERKLEEERKQREYDRNHIKIGNVDDNSNTISIDIDI